MTCVYEGHFFATMSYPLVLTAEKVDEAWAMIVGKKAPAILEQMVRSASHKTFLEEKACPLCGYALVGTKLADEASWRELCISGLCQGCQDNCFGE